MVHVISYYTINTPYEQEIRKLQESCKRFNLSYEFVPVINKGSWILNCGQKPYIISNLLAKYHNDPRDFLYVDADATFERKPEFNFNCEFAYYRLNGELLSGTLFMKNTYNVRTLIHKWCDRQAMNPKVFDQKNLDIVILSNELVDFGNLPAEYVTIFDTMRHVKNPIIVHHQASRRFKNVVSVTG